MIMISLLNDFTLALSVAMVMQLTAGSTACGVPEGDAVRLVNGRNKFEGLVEICYQGEWMNVCAYDWNTKQTAIVCRELGFSGDLNPVAEINPHTFGVETSDEGIQVHCQGKEVNLTECQIISSTSLCNPAGVYCFGNNTEGCSENTIRLVGGMSSYGRVEVCLDGLWGTVCDDGWDSNDATTVCRQLGYNVTATERGIPAVSLLNFGAGSGPIHMTRAQCGNDDTRLTDCDIDKTGINNCEHREDAGVICQGSSNCTDGEVRLVGGENDREGRVEICFSHVWGTVCSNVWDEVDARVVCTQLGYGKQAEALTGLKSGVRPILLSNVSCNESHSELSQCVYMLGIDLRKCHQNNAAGVRCLNVIQPSVTNCIKTPSLQATVTIQKNCANDSTQIETVKINKTMSKAASAYKRRLSIILGAVGGTVILAIIAVILAILFALVALKKRKKVEDNVAGKGPLDNPMYVDMTVGQLSAPNNDNSQDTEREFKNPLYHEPSFDPKNANLCLPIQSHENIYESIFTETALYSDVPGIAEREDYYDVPRALINQWKQVNKDTTDETTLEAIYDLPPDVIQDKNCDDYSSTMGSTDLKLHPHAHPY